MELFDYQKAAARNCWSKVIKGGLGEGICALATGGGKTAIMSAIIKKLRIEGCPRVLVLLNRIELIDQTIGSLKKMMTLLDKDVGVYCGSLNKKQTEQPIIVSMVQSLNNKNELANDFDLVMVDEYHNFENSDSFKRLKAYFSRAKFLYFTATPYQNGKLLKAPVLFKLELDDLIKRGRLAPYRLYDQEKSFDLSGVKISSNGEYLLKQLEEITSDPRKAFMQVEDALLRLEGRNKIVWATTTIKHAEVVAGLLKDKGEDVYIYHSRQNKKDAKDAKDSFELGPARHMVTVMKLSEGYDYPAIDAIVCLRPTRSANLYVQLLGRGLRLSPGKKDCAFLDYGHVVQNLGSPSAPRLIKGAEKKEGEEKELICPACRFVNFFVGSITECQSCSFEFYKDEKTRDLLKNLSKTATNIRRKEMHVITASVDPDYVSTTSKRNMIKIKFATLDGIYYQYIAKEPRNFREETELKEYLREDVTKTKIIKLCENNQWVRKRIYKTQS